MLPGQKPCFPGHTETTQGGGGTDRQTERETERETETERQRHRERHTERENELVYVYLFMCLRVYL